MDLKATVKKYIAQRKNSMKRVMITFPEARQSTNFSCGAASVQAVLYYYGMDVREDVIIEELDVKPTSIVHTGVDPDVIKKSLESIWGLKVDMKEMTIKDVKSYIDKEIPVILAIQAWNDNYLTEKGVHDYSKSYNDGHYVVAIGYNENTMYFDDPSILDNHGYISFNELNNRWHDKDDHGHKLEHLGLAVYGKPHNFNPDELKKIK